MSNNIRRESTQSIINHVQVAAENLRLQTERDDQILSAFQESWDFRGDLPRGRLSQTLALVAAHEYTDGDLDQLAGYLDANAHQFPLVSRMQIMAATSRIEDTPTLREEFWGAVFDGPPERVDAIITQQMNKSHRPLEYTR